MWLSDLSQRQTLLRAPPRATCAEHRLPPASSHLSLKCMSTRFQEFCVQELRFWGLWSMVVCWHFFLLISTCYPCPMAAFHLGLWHLVWISLLGSPCPSSAAPPSWGEGESCSVNVSGIECKMNTTTLARMNLSLVGEGYREKGGHWRGHKQQTHDRLSSKPVSTGCLAPCTGTREPQCCPGLSSRCLTRDATCTYMGCSTASGRKVAREAPWVFLGGERSGGRCPLPHTSQGTPKPLLPSKENTPVRRRSLLSSEWALLREVQKRTPCGAWHPWCALCHLQRCL